MLTFSRPAVMGVVNVTPDSFSDGGLYRDRDKAVAHALTLIKEGADIIDIGGESTRPGAAGISVDEELDRTLPVIEALRRETDTPLSIDTSTPQVMTAAAAAGVSLINDVRALRREGALEAAAATNLPVCLMHMKGEPDTMQIDPQYTDLLGEIRQFFEERMLQCEQAGIPRSKVLLDPGFGFGKTPAMNLSLVNRLGTIVELGRPVVVGLSRKSTIGLLSNEGSDRLAGSIAGAVVAVMKGAAVVRVHDAGKTVEALRVLHAITTETMPATR